MPGKKVLYSWSTWKWADMSPFRQKATLFYQCVCLIVLYKHYIKIFTHFVFLQVCLPSNPPGDVMVCPSPNLALGALRASADKPITASVSFSMEGWFETPLTIGQVLLYYPDPLFSPFPPGMTIIEGSLLTLEVCLYKAKKQVVSQTFAKKAN